MVPSTQTDVGSNQRKLYYPSGEFVKSPKVYLESSFEIRKNTLNHSEKGYAVFHVRWWWLVRVHYIQWCHPAK